MKLELVVTTIYLTGPLALVNSISLIYFYAVDHMSFDDKIFLKLFYYKWLSTLLHALFIGSLVGGFTYDG